MQREPAPERQASRRQSREGCRRGIDCEWSRWFAEYQPIRTAHSSVLVLGPTMRLRRKIREVTYNFEDLRDLLAKASPYHSGDVLAGIAAESGEQRAAAQMTLADLPLQAFLQQALVPYEDDEVTRLILDTHDPVAFLPLSTLT